MSEVTKEFLEEIEQDIAILRDCEFHICNYELSQQMEDEGKEISINTNTYCSCTDFDEVREKIRRVIENK